MERVRDRERLKRDERESERSRETEERNERSCIEDVGLTVVTVTFKREALSYCCTYDGPLVHLTTSTRVHGMRTAIMKFHNS